MHHFPHASDSRSEYLLSINDQWFGQLQSKAIAAPMRR